MQQFIELTRANVSVYVRSIADFVSAQIAFERADEDVRERCLAALCNAAGQVRIDCTTYETIASVEAGLRARTRNSMIYEQYAADLLDQLFRTARTMPPLVADALRVCANESELVEAARNVHEAVREAREALYGEAGSDASGLSDGDIDYPWDDDNE